MGRRENFKTEAPELPDLGELSKAETLEKWVAEAPLHHRATTSEEAPLPPAKPWKRMRKDDPPTIAFNLRLNNYERELLAYAAEQDGASMQLKVKRLVFPALEKLYGGSKLAPKRIHRRAKKKEPAPEKETP